MTSKIPIVVERVSIQGAGQFGFALASLLAKKNPHMPIVLYDPVRDIVDVMQKTRSHPYFHKNDGDNLVKLPENVSASHDQIYSVAGADMVILAVPGQFIRSCVRTFVPHVKHDIIILNVAKALEQGTHALLHDVVEDEWKKLSKHKLYFAALAGGMLAEEVSQGWPIAADVACEDIRIARHIKSLLATPAFKLRVTTDVTGVELAGAFKNVVAIGAGMFDGLGLAVSSKSAFISEAAVEMRDLAVHLGARNDTYGLGTHAWLGDLLTTCFGNSRNRLFGEMIGSGLSVEEAVRKLEAQKKRSEGYLTTKAFYEVAKERNLDVPFLRILHGVLFEGKKAKDALNQFFVEETLLDVEEDIREAAAEKARKRNLNTPTSKL